MIVGTGTSILLYPRYGAGILFPCESFTPERIRRVGPGGAPRRNEGSAHGRQKQNQGNGAMGDRVKRACAEQVGTQKLSCAKREHESNGQAAKRRQPCLPQDQAHDL